jgi:hypothetical protein
MTPLAPNLFTRRFKDFMEIGRARVQALAPRWTDYNAHDPGITIMELLAWISEAQLYSLSRMRRDERIAYAALLGIQPGGMQPANGLIWPDSLDPATPVATYTASSVLPKYTAVTMADSPGPRYRTLQDLLWVPGEMQFLVTRQGSTSIDLTAKNKRGKLVFYPFGQGSAIGTTLSLSFHCRDERGLFGAGNHNALWPLGVLTSIPTTGANASTGADIASYPGSRLSAALIADGERFAVRIVADSSQSMLTSGVILLDLSGVATSPVDFKIEFTAPHGLIRPPRILRIEANVLPIEQSESVDRESHFANGLPGWSFTLDKPGLRFAPGAAPVAIQTIAPPLDWRQTDRLSELGANDSAFEFDPDSGTVTFGNGINGRVPSADTHVLASYQISDGAAGNIARNRRWIVSGIQGLYGTNLAPLAGGADATTLAGMEFTARREVRDQHPLITRQDIIDAALSLPLFEVGRAWVLDSSGTTPNTGTTTLIAMRSRPGGAESPLPPETALWLSSIEQTLRGRMPLGSRLLVKGPQYVTFTINANIETLRAIDPVQVKNAITKALADRFHLIPCSPIASAVDPGVPVSKRDVAGTIRAVDGVSQIVTLNLATADGTKDPIPVTANSIAKLDLVNSQLSVGRPGSAGGAA